MSSSRLEKYLPGNKRVRMLVLMAVDICTVGLASFLGLFIRFDMNLERIPMEYIEPVLSYLPFYLAATLRVFFLFRLYSTMWSVAGVREAGHIIGACGLASLIQIAGMLMLELKVPRSYYVLSFFTLCACEGLVRLSYRILTSMRLPGKSRKAGEAPSFLPGAEQAVPAVCAGGLPVCRVLRCEHEPCPCAAFQPGGVHRGSGHSAVFQHAD